MGAVRWQQLSGPRRPVKPYRHSSGDYSPLPPFGRELSASRFARAQRGIQALVVVGLELTVDLVVAPPGAKVVEQVRQARGQVVALLVEDHVLLVALGREIAAVGQLGAQTHVVDLER